MLHKILTIIIYGFTIIVSLFSLVCMFAGAGCLFNILLGLPMLGGYILYIVINLLMILLILYIEK